MTDPDPKVPGNLKDRLGAPIPKHRVLREVLRHYIEYRELVAQHGGDGVIEHGYWVYDDPEDPESTRYKVEVTLSLWDLIGCLKEQKKGGILSDRKREAIFYNVIQDKLQREVAEIMGITTVSVGQYVEQGMLQLSEAIYFAEEVKKSDDSDAVDGIHAGSV